MNKFIIGDLVYLPQGSVLHRDENKILSYTIQKPTIATYLGQQHATQMHKIDIFGWTGFVTETEIETLNFARKDVHQVN